MILFCFKIKSIMKKYILCMNYIKYIFSALRYFLFPSPNSTFTFDYLATPLSKAFLKSTNTIFFVISISINDDYIFLCLT